ncbi:MAG: MotA/TolQ/ExbB proton channel family protein [Pseudomonadota bacterium]
MHKIFARLMVCTAIIGFGGFSVLTSAQTPPTPTTPAVDATPAAAPAKPATPPPAKKLTAAEENPFGIAAMIEEGDMVTKITLFILVVMSMGSWYIIFTKFYETTKIAREAKAAASFWSASTVRAGADALKEDSPFRFIAEKGIEATQKHTGLMGQIDLSTWITMGIGRAVENIQSRAGDGMSFLATVGSTAPFVGLFGTVWGIYHALVKIGITGQASIDKVAGPVGEALIMTAIGLAVAVPAVLGYNFIVRKNKTSMDQVRAFGADVHAVLLATANVKK